ncbi:putative protein phosphatase 2C 8 [Platanthera guangdongensis]|uniref:Uncharacterized protein n=1 Tax=Platanthera guangdongensis TaxID=2320717 RepID=A0ABR2MXS8_9ASPA
MLPHATPLPSSIHLLHFDPPQIAPSPVCSRTCLLVKSSTPEVKQFGNPREVETWHGKMQLAEKAVDPFQFLAKILSEGIFPPQHHSVRHLPAPFAHSPHIVSDTSISHQVSLATISTKMLYGMVDIKPEDDLEEESFIAKRIKITDIDVCNTVKENKEEQNLDVHAVDVYVMGSAISMGQNGGDLDEKVSGGIEKQIQSIETLQETISCTSNEVQDQLVDNLFNIDAAAAEDKGSRHTMEDAWVVLPDASLDYPGSSRFLFP